MSASEPGPDPVGPAVDRLVRRYYAYQATATFGFVTPVFVLFLLLRDLTFAEIATLSALNWAVVTLGEVPTGYVGDRLGRRNSLLLSTALATASLLGFLLARSLLAFAVLYGLWALAIAFRSGAEGAWLFDALADRGAAGRYTAVKGRGGAVKRWVGAGAMLAGGLLYVVQPTWPFVAAAGLHGLGVPVLLALPAGRHEGDGDRPTVAAVMPTVRRTLTRPPLRSFVAYVALLVAAVGAAATYVQPVTVSVLEARLAGLAVHGYAVPEQATLGVLYAGFAAVEAAASDAAGAVEARFGRGRAILALVPSVGLVLVAAALAPVLAIPAFLAMRAGAAVVDPLASGYLNDRLRSAGRATVLSAASMGYAVVRLPLVVAAGVVADAAAPLVAVGLAGAVAVVGAAVVIAVERPV
ncbi:MAG: MFS transporter [Halobacteriales archaeon]